MNKRFLAAPVVGILAFGGVYAFAATLGVTPENLAAGDEVVAPCDGDGVATSYTTAWDATDERYEVTGVTVSGIDVETTTTATTCAGENLKVTLVDADGASIGEGVLADPINEASETVTIANGAASAENAVGIHVVIDG